MTRGRPDWPTPAPSGPNIIINNSKNEGEDGQMPSFVLRVLEYVGWFAAFVAAITITSCVVVKVLSEVRARFFFVIFFFFLRVRKLAWFDARHKLSFEKGAKGRLGDGGGDE
jgi:hypothetical protein